MKYRALLGPLLASALSGSMILAACGGAIDNGDLYKKDQGSASSSGASGSTPAPTATATTLPAPGPPSSPPKPAPKCEFSFQADVLTVFVQANCTNANCHGGPLPRNLPRIDASDPASTYKEFLAFRTSNGKPYVVMSTNPSASAMSCNLRASCGVAMPPNDKLSPKELAVIDGWLACGAPLN